MLKLLNVGHFGVYKIVCGARDAMFWPGIDSQIKDMILKFEVCLKHRHPNQLQEPRCGDLYTQHLHLITEGINCMKWKYQAEVKSSEGVSQSNDSVNNDTTSSLSMIE